MQSIKKIHPIHVIILSLLALGFAWVGVVHAPAAGAQGVKSNLCEGANLTVTEGSDTSCANNDACAVKAPGGECTQTASEAKVNKLITAIVNIISVIVGILAVIFIIIGGAKYITSGGDSAKVSSGKNTVIYAIVGLIIVALAQFIVRFVLSKTK